MAKAIILARVSSEAQDYTQQVKELKKCAIRDGYNEEDLIIINNKESATKNDEEHRLGLAEMKEDIKNDPSINCVYVREISRIGRRYDVLSNIKSFLVSNKTQLVVTDNNRRLLKEDGEISLEGSIMFEIACESAISEMKDKVIRFREGKIKAVNNGKCVGKSVLYGYTTDDDGFIKVNEETAGVVRWIFDTYANTDATLWSIAKELVESGKRVVNYTYKSGGTDFVRNVIINPAYIGGVSRIKQKRAVKYEYKYEPIVTKEIWEKANAKLKKGRNRTKRDTKYQLYAKQLIKCICGHTMTPSICNAQAYKCAVCGKTIGINQVEFIAWRNAINLKCQHLTKQTKEEKERIANEMENNANKIQVSNERIAELEIQSVKAYKQYIKGNVKESLYESTVAEINDTIKQQKKLITQLNQKNVSLRKMIEGITEYSAIDPKTIETIEDEAEKVKITHSVIDKIQLSVIDDAHIRIDVVPLTHVNALPLPTHYVYDRTSPTKPQLFEVTEYISDRPNKVKDLTTEVPRKYKRSRYERKKRATTTIL